MPQSKTAGKLTVKETATEWKGPDPPGSVSKQVPNGKFDVSSAVLSQTQTKRMMEQRKSEKMESPVVAPTGKDGAMEVDCDS
ncbi:unnamed protein product [Linum trigynum]|uniref:Uncharacterized protein n=1 Tax=Linum trigynum TaxID=586398 RepID=A0AAV2EVZ3_9ROSI